MIKSLSLLSLSLFLASWLHAQESAVKRFGIKAGVNVSHMDFSKGVPPSPTQTTWSTGAHIGFVMVVPIVSRLSFQPEYLYSIMNSKVKNADTAYKLNYLSLPLFLKVKLHNKLYVLAGPQFDILVSAKRTANGTTENTTHDTEERSIAAVGGIEYDLIHSFSLSARYFHGFNHIGLGQRSSMQEFKFSMVQVAACFKF